MYVLEIAVMYNIPLVLEEVRDQLNSALIYFIPYSAVLLCQLPLELRKQFGFRCYGFWAWYKLFELVM